MTEDEKKAADAAKAVEAAKAADAAKDKRIAELESKLAKASAEKPSDDKPTPAEEMTPTPTQEELDRVRLGGQVDAAAGAYTTRQIKPS